MDISNAFKTELFRPIVTTLIPGMFALAPFACLVLTKFSASNILNNITLISVIYCIIAVTIGMILEDVGSTIEHNFGKLVKKKIATYDSDWYEYLKSKTNGNMPIIADYIKTIVLRMKFEFSFSLSLFISEIGLYFILNPKEYYLIYLIVTIIALYLLREGYCSVALLGELRQEIRKQ